MLKQPSPDTVKNKLAVVRRYITLSNGDLSGVNSLWVKNAIEAICRVKYHSIRKKQPISVKNLKKIILSLPEDYVGNNIKTMLLLMYYGAFRQSEVAPAKMGSFNQEVNMCKKDIRIKNDCIYISLRWAKNCQRFNEQHQVQIPALSDKRICPVYNLKKVFRATKIKRPDDPVFVFKDNVPISVNFLRSQWKKCFQKLKLSTSDYSLHSIRKSATTYAY